MNLTFALCFENAIAIFTRAFVAQIYFIVHMFSIDSSKFHIENSIIVDSICYSDPFKSSRCALMYVLFGIQHMHTHSKKST